MQLSYRVLILSWTKFNILGYLEQVKRYFHKQTERDYIHIYRR